MPPAKKPSAKKSASSASTSGTLPANAAKSSQNRASSQPTLNKGTASATAPPGENARKNIFGNWTGKTPVSLLYELCQRNGWMKPSFAVNKYGKGFQCHIFLGKEDKKAASGQSVRSVKFVLQGKYFQDAQEAKHAAATYVLHRVNSHTNMHRLLPPQMRDLWAEFEASKVAAHPDSAKYLYASDPFIVEDLKRQEEQNKQREIAAVAAEKEKSRELDIPELYLSANDREMVEDLIKQSELDIQRLGSMKQGRSSHQTQQKLMSRFVKMGFREAHVEEAIEHSADELGIMNWLVMHVPEDDLPDSVLSKITNEISTQKHTTETLATEYAVRRLLQIGFSRDKILTALLNNNYDEVLAMLFLYKSHIVETWPEHDGDVTEELSSQLEDELMALESIYPDRYRRNSLHQPHTFISLDLAVEEFSSNTTLDIYIPTASVYPFEPPLVVIRNEQLPAYIKLAAVEHITAYAMDLLGQPMLFSLVTWAEENLANIVRNPPKLTQLKKGDLNRHRNETTQLERITNSTETLTVGGTVKRSQRPGQATLTRSLKDDVRLQKLLEQKQISTEYQNLLSQRQRLPSFKDRDRILECIHSNQVTIICGSTGCGKSTQIPQLVLDLELARSNGSVTKCYCTQPRRISAISLATRVSKERCEEVGGSVGYIVRGEHAVSPRDTKLVYVTTGILLRMIQTDPLLKEINYLFVDEVHERGVDSDFLLLLLKQALKARPELKVILMSATVNAELFSSYFDGAAILDIPGTSYPVQDLFLEDVVRQVRYDGPIKITKSKRPTSAVEHEDENELEDRYDMEESDVEKFRYLDQNSDKINYDLIVAVAQHIITNMDNTSADNTSKGAILIFLPGVMEIQKCIDALNSSNLGEPCVIYPLHANLPVQEQNRVFSPTSKRKIVVATNIAETSVTIDDVVYVIDTGRVKLTSHTGRLTSLAETWVSKAAATQRRGRAGRVRPGFCFKLFSRRTWKKMSDDTPPEMTRVSLEQLVLMTKSIGVEDPAAFLSNAITPPSTTSLKHAISVLCEVKAMDEQQQLTPLGKHLAGIPADVRLAKMLIFGVLLQCLDPILTIVSVLTIKSPFVSPSDKRDEAQQAKMKFKQNKSDLMTDVEAFNAWLKITNDGQKRSKQATKQERQFLESTFLSYTTLTQIRSMRIQYLEVLSNIGFVDPEYPSRYKDTDLVSIMQDGYNRYSNSASIIIAAMTAALYPQVVKVKHPETTYEQIHSGTIALENKPNEMKYYTKEDGRVFIHPSSVNFGVTKWETKVLTYHTKLSTSKIFLRDVTMVHPLSLFLFGGEVTVNHERQQLILDKYVIVKSFPRVATLVLGLRKLLDDVLEKKIERPEMDISQTEVVKCLCKLLLNT